MNRIAESIIKNNKIIVDSGRLEEIEYRRLAYLLIKDLSYIEFKEVFQTQRIDYVGVDEDETKFQVAFQKHKLSNPIIFKPKKLNKLQLFIKYIFKL